MKDGKDTPRKSQNMRRRGPKDPGPQRLVPAEAAPSPEQEKYRLLAENAPLGIALVASDGRYQYLNPKFAALFGYTLEDIPTGQEWVAQAYPDDDYRHRVIADWKEYLQECQAGEAEPRAFSVTCKDGSTKVIKFRAVPLAGGEQFILCEDITALQEAEGARREAQELFRVLYESAADAFFLHESGKILEVNQQSCDSLGYSREELLGLTVADIEVGLSLEDLEALWRHPQSLPSTILGVHRRKDGSTFPVEVRARNFEHQGRRLRFSLARDITARSKTEAALRESELKYRALVEQIPAITYTTTPDDFMAKTFISPQIEAILGFTPADFKTDPHIWADHLHPEDRDRVFFTTAKCLETGKPFVCEYRMVDWNGQIVWFRDQGQLVKDSSGGHLFLQGVMLDITERKQNEEKLHQAQEDWERTFDAIPDLVMILDSQHRIVRANRAMAHNFGYEPKEAAGKFCYQVVHGLEAPPPYCPCSATLSQGQPLQVEMWDQKMQRYFLVTTSPIRDLSGRVVGSVQVGTDITERKLAEEALKKSEEKYRLLVGQIPAVVFKGYGDWSIECFDDKIETLTGYAKEDFNRRRLIWRDLIPEEEMPYVKKVFQQALQGDGSYFREHRIRKKSGEFAWVQCRGQIFRDDQGEMEYVSGVTFDITARKEAEEALKKSEERYRFIAENVSDVIWTTDMDLRFTYVSPSVQQVLGFTPEEILGRTIGKILPPASFAQALEVISEEMTREQQGLSDPKRYRVLELDEIHKDGARLRTEVKAGFVRDHHNYPIGVLGVTRDITKRKAAEEALRRREAMSEAVSYAAEKFLKSRSWEDAIQEVLERLGQTVQVSRVYIFENHAANDGTLLANRRYEWVAANIAPQIDNPELKGTSYKAAGLERWAEVLPQGQIISGCVRDFPPSEKKLLEAAGIKSLITVPIFVGQHWWGGLGFEDCLQEREWSSMEVDALVTAADILGLTILHQKEEAALRESEEKLRFLSYQLLNAQERERGRLAYELHNVLGHDLLLMKLKLESLREELGQEQRAAAKEVRQLLRSLQGSVSNVRRLCQDLTPGDLEDLGLTVALQDLVENLALAQKLTWQTELDDLRDLFEMPVQTGIYRVVQEALTNIGRHAQAQNLWLRAQRTGAEVTFVIEDDGKGFRVAQTLASKRTLGLLAMEERVQILGGTFAIVSRKQKGTRITFTIPVSTGGTDSDSL